MHQPSEMNARRSIGRHRRECKRLRPGQVRGPALRSTLEPALPRLARWFGQGRAQGPGATPPCPRAAAYSRGSTSRQSTSRQSTSRRSRGSTSRRRTGEHRVASSCPSTPPSFIMNPPRRAGMILARRGRGCQMRRSARVYGRGRSPALSPRKPVAPGRPRTGN
jgi:hypothetical protein